MDQPPATRGREWAIGVQSFTYRNHSVEEMCAALTDTPVTAVELCHEHVLPEMAVDTVEDRLGRIEGAGLSVCGYGVVDFDGNPEDAEAAVDLVDRLDGAYLSLTFPPDDRDVIDALLAHADEYGIDLAIHNHGPDSTYPTAESVDAVLSDVADPRLGACVDTGHFLRAGEPPSEVLPLLGDRVHALHLKDFVDETTEAVPGEGELDVPELLSLLDEHTDLEQPLVIEYEADPDDPTPAVQRAAEHVQAASE